MKKLVGWVQRGRDRVLLGCAAAPPKLRLITQIMLGSAFAPPNLQLQIHHGSWKHKKVARQSAFFRALTLGGSALSQIHFTTYVSKVLK